MRAFALAVLLPLGLLACGGSSSSGSSTSSAPTAVPTPTPITAAMNALGSSGVTGTVSVVKGTGSFDVTMKLTGLAPNSVHVNHIHKGSCAAPGPIAYALQTIQADASGNATVMSTVATDYVIPAGGWYANVHTGPDLTSPANAKSISCGDLVAG